MHDDSIVSLLGTLCAAPVEPRRWTAFLNQLGTTCDIENAALISHDISNNRHSVVAGLGAALKESSHQYETYFWQFDEWTARLPVMRLAEQVYFGEEAWPEPEFLKSVFYNEFLREFDIYRLAAMFFPWERGSFDGISLYRGKDDDEFGPHQIAILNALAPHLKVALQTRRKLLSLEDRISDLENALDSIASALILLDANQNAVFVNRKARSLLARENGITLRSRKLMGRDARDSSRLQQLIGKASAHLAYADRTSGGSMPLHRPGRRPLHILVSPLLANNDPACERVSIAVFIDDPDEDPVIPADVLRTLFGLTPAEARLALSLLEGKSIGETAELCGLSRETVKSQMKALMSKTGVHRQGELIRLMSRLTAAPLSD